MNRKVTQQEFNYFKERCLYWIDRLQLSEWYWYFEQIKLKENTLSCVTSDTEGRKATISFSTRASSVELVPSNLNMVALEEVLHTLLTKQSDRAEQVCSRRIVEEEEHIIINHLIKALINDKE